MVPTYQSINQKHLPKLIINHTNDYRVLSSKMKVGILTVYPATFMLYQTEDQLAAIIAHELIHHFKAHDQSLIKIHQDIFPFKDARLSRSRKKHEVQADILSLILLKNAGYSLSGATESLQILDLMFSKLAPVITPPNIHTILKERLELFYDFEKIPFDSAQKSIPLSDTVLSELDKYKRYL